MDDGKQLHVTLCPADDGTMEFLFTAHGENNCDVVCSGANFMGCKKPHVSAEAYVDEMRKERAHVIFHMNFFIYPFIHKIVGALGPTVRKIVFSQHTTSSAVVDRYSGIPVVVLSDTEVIGNVHTERFGRVFVENSGVRFVRCFVEELIMTGMCDLTLEDCRIERMQILGRGTRFVHAPGTIVDSLATGSGWTDVVMPGATVVVGFMYNAVQLVDAFLCMEITMRELWFGAAIAHVRTHPKIVRMVRLAVRRYVDRCEDEIMRETASFLSGRFR